MNAKYDLIDTFSRRPTLSQLTCTALRQALVAQYPTLQIDPQTAVVTGAPTVGGAALSTLLVHLQTTFSSGKTLRWQNGVNTLVANLGAPDSVTFTVDMEQLAILLDSVSLGLPRTFMQALVTFWDLPDGGGSSPWRRLVDVLEQQAPRTALPAVQGPVDEGATVLAGQGRHADFEKKALEILESQLSVIQDVLSAGLGTFDEIERYLAMVTDISPMLGGKHSGKFAVHVSRLDQLPSWLATASSADRLDYSRRISALAVVAARANGQSWDDDLPPILEYAKRMLQDTLRKDHPQAFSLTLDDVTVHLAKTVAVPAPSAGQFMAMGSVEHQQMSVATFALQNLSSLPSGTLTLSTRDGGPLPGWLTPDYIKGLVARVDVGRTYPALVQRFLISDHTQATRRQTLFADQLRQQLPLKALEQKIRGQGELTHAGYQLVCSVMAAPDTDTGSISPAAVLRPLAWVAYSGATADVVSNMFVIGDADPATGPVVLYRPFAAVPLTEFATLAKLRDAITQSGQLQEDVLTWMTDRGRQRYANGGFNEPHVLSFGLGSDFAPLQVPAPAQLAVSGVEGAVTKALFAANARALVDLADRQSVSNAESRWALIQRAGWLALDVVMPFMSGAVGSALWLVQLMSAVDHVLVAESRKASRDGAEAWTSLLLTISMILLHQGYAPRMATHPVTPTPTATDPVPAVDVRLHEDRDSSAPTPVTARQPLLDFSWCSSNHRLTQAQARNLARLRSTPQPLLEAPSVEPGREGLFQRNQQWWAQLDSGIYEVTFQGEDVYIVDPQDPLARGPRVQRVNKVWVLDLSLGLRGGGPKRNARLLAQQNAATLERVTARDAQLEQRKALLYVKFSEWDTSCRATVGQVSPDIYAQIEAALTELEAVFEERMQMQQELRVADRVGDKAIAVNLQGVVRRIAFLEGVMLENVGKLARAQLSQLNGVTEGNVTADNLDAYMKMFDDLMQLQDRGTRWSKRREDLWQQLRDLPKVGESFWREEVLALQASKILTHLEWRIDRMWSLLEQSFNKSNMLYAVNANELKTLRTDERLHAACSSQAELEKPNDYSQAEQIAVLESSLREYHRALMIATCTHESAPEALSADYFSRFVEELTWISDRAEKRLSDSIRESTEPPEQPLVYAPRIKQSRKRVIKTRGQRTLVGSLKEGEPDFSGEVVQITQARTDAVVGTYHLHDDGEWVEVQVVPAAKPASREAGIAVAELKRQATAALGRVEADIATARRQARRADEPADMQDILLHKADQLTALADRLAARVSDVGQSAASSAAQDATATQKLIKALQFAASRFVEEGRALRVAMIKAQPPTAARLSYLAREGEVHIARFAARKNMSGSKRNDFLQEYLIRDKSMAVLWWAHFHYASETAAADAFTAAHLKLPAQRLIGYTAQVKAARNNKEVISIYRSAIGKDAAQRLFLALASETVADD